MGALVNQTQDMFYLWQYAYIKVDERYIKITSYMRQSRTRKPLKPLIRKNRERVSPTKYSGTTFGVLKDERYIR